MLSINLRLLASLFHPPVPAPQIAASPPPHPPSTPFHPIIRAIKPIHSTPCKKIFSFFRPVPPSPPHTELPLPRTSVPALRSVKTAESLDSRLTPVSHTRFANPICKCRKKILTLHRLKRNNRSPHQEQFLSASSRGVAQSGSAPGLGPGGRRFESCHPDNSKKLSDVLSDSFFRFIRAVPEG